MPTHQIPQKTSPFRSDSPMTAAPQGISTPSKAVSALRISASQISPVASALLNAKLPNGQYLIPSAQITNAAQATALGYDAVTQGPNATSTSIKASPTSITSRARKIVSRGKYYVQHNPTTNPFGAVGISLGFPQQLSAGSQVGSIDNSVILTPRSPGNNTSASLAWRLTHIPAKPSRRQIWHESVGLQHLPSNRNDHLRSNHLNGLQFGSSVSFGNAGMYQNQWEYGTTLNWVKGKHTLSFGASGITPSSTSSTTTPPTTPSISKLL